MSDRGMDAATLAEIAKVQTNSCVLLELHFDSAVQYFNNSNRNVTWNSNTYIPGHVLSVPVITESLTSSVNQISVTLTGVPTANISTALSEEVFGRNVILRRLYFDSSYATVGVVTLFEGEFSSEPNISDDYSSGGSVISYSAASIWADFDRVAGRRGNDEDQQFLFPGDKGMEYASQVTAKIPWGRPTEGAA